MGDHLELSYSGVTYHTGILSTGKLLHSFEGRERVLPTSVMSRAENKSYRRQILKGQNRKYPLRDSEYP